MFSGARWQVWKWLVHTVHVLIATFFVVSSVFVERLLCLCVRVRVRAIRSHRSVNSVSSALGGKEGRRASASALGPARPSGTLVDRALRPRRWSGPTRASGPGPLARPSPPSPWPARLCSGERISGPLSGHPHRGPFGPRRGSVLDSRPGKVARLSPVRGDTSGPEWVGTGTLARKESRAL